MTPCAPGRRQTLTLRNAFHFEAFEGLRVAERVDQRYLLVPAKARAGSNTFEMVYMCSKSRVRTRAQVKEVYIASLLAPEALAARRVRSLLAFCSTIRNAQLLWETLRELGVGAACLHSAMPQRRRMARARPLAVKGTRPTL